MLVQSISRQAGCVVSKLCHAVHPLQRVNRDHVTFDGGMQVEGRESEIKMETEHASVWIVLYDA